MGQTHAVFLPGAVLPAAVAYPALVDQLRFRLGDALTAVVKELELYRDATPPPGYGLETEVEGIRVAADAAGFERFHLVGYSAGGASSLAFATAHPDRLASLALLEPAWAGNEGRSPEETAVDSDLHRVLALPEDQRLPLFVRAQLRDDVPSPPRPDGPPPPWMASRPAGLAALIGAFDAFPLDLDALRRLEIPVYYALGGRSNPDYYERQSRRLAEVFGDFTLERYDDRHHFDPPHRTEPERLASALRSLWRGAA